MTPNSLADVRAVGEGFVEDGPGSVAVAFALVRRMLRADPEFLSGGDAAAEVRLEMRGILVGVSFGRPETEFNSDDGGSLNSFKVWELLVPFVLTEGDPAMVGSWLRLRREESDCFCMELTVWEVSLDVDEVVRVIAGCVIGVEVELVEGLRRATRWAVAGSKADICIGGKFTGDFGFLGSVDDKVWKGISLS